MRRLILASLAAAAMLASCSKESTMDVAITSAQIPIEFSTYSSSATTKGNPVDSNAEFSGTANTFEVIAYLDSDGDGTEAATTAPAKYFDWSTVTYSSSSWTNTDAMYWPTYDATIYFGAIYNNLSFGGTTPEITDCSFSVAEGVAEDYKNTPSLTFKYTVPGERGNSDAKTSADQKDILYAITSSEYKVPTTDEGATSTDEAVNLNFKHALSQIGFTATKSGDITVTVSSVTICNVMSSGTFTATSVTDNSTDADDNGDVLQAGVDKDDFGSWGSLGDIAHFDATLVSADGVSVTAAAGETATVLTNATATIMSGGASSNSDTEAIAALILMPQALTKWSTTTSSGSSTTGKTATVSGTDSYLAIKCQIYHNNSDVPIIDGYVYVPFGTEDLTTTDADSDGAWAPGYRYTYNLHFGGGYTDSTPNDEDEDPIPDPGNEPDPDDMIETLRPITYTVTVDEWIDYTSSATEQQYNL